LPSNDRSISHLTHFLFLHLRKTERTKYALTTKIRQKHLKHLSLDPTFFFAKKGSELIN